MTELVKTTDGPQDRLSEAQFERWSSMVTADDKDVRWLTSECKLSRTSRVLDVGGGNGQFASLLAARMGCHVDVIDPSDVARRRFTDSPSCRFMLGDFLSWAPTAEERYDLVIFRLVLHHLVGDRDRICRANQLAALRKACTLLKPGGQVYVLENIYDPMLGTDTSARLIYSATVLKFAKRLFRRLGANTAGEGVRFHSLAAWKQLFQVTGLGVAKQEYDYEWAQPFPLWQRLPFLCRRRYEWLVLLSAASHAGSMPLPL